MTGENRCPHCGCELPANAPEALCPRCLLQAGLGNDAERTAQTPAIEGPGTHIGRYELLELVGEGGMGMVYLAEQKEPVRRKVALKIVKLGMDTMHVIARLQAEQQTLAMLDHPNIARVFDAGTTDSGRPYFVMEYVEGVPITKYCDRQKLSIEERLRLFLQVCAAIQHAHQKGVLHRDIKPSNILVSANDHAALPKIIDFGIAKAVHQPLTEQTSITEQGQLLGTPEYMSPEQADMAYSEVDTRSDVYSLGVVLYELLAGATPFEAETLRKRGVEHIRQIIRNEEPKTPSVRLTTLGEQAREVALMRRTQLLTLARWLKKELEWIPLKAMRKERARAALPVRLRTGPGCLQLPRGHRSAGRPGIQNLPHTQIHAQACRLGSDGHACCHCRSPGPGRQHPDGLPSGTGPQAGSDSAPADRASPGASGASRADRAGVEQEIRAISRELSQGALYQSYRIGRCGLP